MDKIDKFGAAIAVIWTVCAFAATAAFVYWVVYTTAL